MTIDILSITIYWLRLHNNSQSNLVVLFFPSLLKKKKLRMYYIQPVFYALYEAVPYSYNIY